MKKVFFFYIAFCIYNLNLSAQDAMKNISESMILVRLQTNEKLIAHHIKQGNKKLAQIEQEKQKRKNQEIINAFESDWQLCPVYFFYSNHSQEIIDKNFNNVFKKNERLKLNNQEQEQLKDNFLIVYFGPTQGKLKFNALVVANSRMKQLTKPSPRFVRTYKGLGFFQRKVKKIINILERKIHWHYSK